MPRQTRFPILLDECIILSISYLLRERYIYAFADRIEEIGWIKNDAELVKLVVKVHIKMEELNGKIQLQYFINGYEFKYIVAIISKPSNLGKGKVYYFKCPFTGMTCKNLYLINGLFVHRLYFHKCLYSSQTYSWYTRQIKLSFDILRHEVSHVVIPRKRYSKTHYRGIPTKRMISVLNKRERLFGRCNDKYNDWVNSIH